MTLYRGPGGTGSATSDADTTLYQDFLNQTIAARDAALQAETNAELAETNAETAEANAETAEANAAASASAAATSASNASTSASNAASSASSASSSASAASTSASNAAVSASSAAASASAALASENNAETAETNAAASASAAATSASNAASSASAAATSATNAANSASSAATSATSASNSASNAATSATNAANSATSASNSASAAAASASEAAGYAASINPADLVHISGTETITGAKTFSQTITGSITGNAGTVTNGVYTTGDQTIAGTKTFSSNPVLSAGTVNGLAFLNASKVLTTGSALTFDGSRLGIGLATPDATLNVNGYSGSGLIRIGAGATGESNILFSDSATGTGQYAGFLQYLHTSDALAFGAGASEQMRLTSTGLGIGTSSPAQKLHVSGGSVRVDNTNIMFLNPDYGPGTMAVQGFSNVPLVFCTNNTERLRISADGNLGLGVTPSAWGAAWKAYQYVGGSMASPNGSNNLILQNAYNDGTNYRYIGTAAASYYQQSAGQHIWVTAPSGTAGNAISFTQALTLNANGNLALQGGNTSANGVGITFPATQSASSDANTLDDYEEGTWTPTITGSGGAATYNQQTGRYTKIGRVVTASFYLDFAKNTLTGDLNISGLPFSGGFNYEYGMARFNSSGTVPAPANGIVGLQIGAGNSAFGVQIGTATGITAWNASTLDAGQDILGTITYTV